MVIYLIVNHQSIALGKVELSMALMVSLVSLTDYGLLPPFQNIRSFSLLLTDIYLDAFVCRFTYFTSNLCTKRYLNICVLEKAKTYFGTEGVCLNGLSRSRGDGSSTIVIRTHHNLLPQRGDLYVVMVIYM
jgi:hypothetical protein